MTEEHPIEGLMTTAMENLQKMVEVNTIIGDPVKSPDGSLIIPVSKLGFGFAAGGSEFNSNQSQGDSDATLPFGGGSGGGVSITPVAFLIVSEQGIKMVHLDQNTHLYEKMIDFAPQVIEKVQQIIKDSNGSTKKEDKKEKSEKSNPSQYDI
ncbi:GerW family sporulation protein [Oceanobacillus longus]|uniref:GerW family sporulation protein n=1 Tax=Oceanobacillus longus TaxID=930120 RepID=A0ABV8GUN1_9BACI